MQNQETSTPDVDACLEGARQLLSRQETLRASQDSPAEIASGLDDLIASSVDDIDPNLVLLADAGFPPPRKCRLLARYWQAFLETLAGDLTALRLAPEAPAPSASPTAATLCQVLRALSRHLLISYLLASPAGIGIWHRLHQTDMLARKLGIAESARLPGEASPQEIDHAAALRGGAQAASFTSREIKFVADYLELAPSDVFRECQTPHFAPDAFWIDPAGDTPPTPCARKMTASDEALYFRYERIVSRLEQRLASLEAGDASAQAPLPSLVATPAGAGVLRRLVNCWGKPPKRRFLRRRQTYRATLAIGFHSVWRTFQDTLAESPSLSNWMITNESPEGFAIMHVSGETGPIQVGDVTAMRAENSEHWQTCIVRWANSENQEHIELGLQILATRVVPALLALPGSNDAGRPLPVLILPEIPPLRTTEMLVAPCGLLKDQDEALTLVVQGKNLAIREVRKTTRNEQNGSIEIFSIEREHSLV